jgi:hypothetical protein
MTNVIAGKLDYLKMVKGADNELYNKLFLKFNLLINTNKLSSKSQNRKNHLNSILNLLIQDGLESAMNKYNNKKDELK